MNTRHITEEAPSGLRTSDLMRFFKQAGRTSKCPHCEHSGSWEFHIKLDPKTGQAEDDAELIEFKVEMPGSLEAWTKCAAITCPRCGHFAMISIYKIVDSLGKEAAHG